jgi:hypothetical protein
MVKVPTFLVAAQWALLLALGFLVIVVYRQLGSVFGRERPHTQLGPPVGSSAATLEYERVSDGLIQFCRPGDGIPMMIGFVDPICPACERLVATLDDAFEDGELRGMRVLLLTTYPTSYIQISDAFRSTRFEIGWIDSHQAREKYHVLATPLAVAINGSGIVKASGPTIERQELHKFISACIEDSADFQPQPTAASLPEIP